MSGIDMIAEKMKAKKMTMDDLPSPIQNGEVNLKIENTHKEKGESSLTKPVFQKEHSSEKTNNSPPLSENLNHPNLLQSLPNATPDLTFDELTKNDLQPKKHTFYISHEMHIAFNDIYAKKILSGKQITKSELISEAVALLIEKENTK